MIQVKTPEQLRLMRAAGLVVGQTLAALREAVASGVSLLDLDALAAERIRAAGAVPSFLGYHGFPATICASVNDRVVHGIPDATVLRDGDLISIDCGAILDGWHGDSAVTVPVGTVDPAVAALATACEQAMWRGLAAARVGGRVNDIGAAVERYVDDTGAGYSIVEEYVGHGIGTEMHQEPQVPNYAHRGSSPKMVTGMALAVEPMLNLGSARTRTLADGWTVVTADGSASAHFEHTVALTDDGPWVLTALDGGAADLARLGVPTPATVGG